MMDREKQRVLVVDDERFNLNILAELLKSEYTVILAKSGKQAVERAIKQPPDLILLDVMMPEMDGYQVIRELKSTDLTRNIPVIFITALGAAEEEEKGLLLGAVDYIVKPFNPAIVRARVGAHMKIVRQRKLLENEALLDGLTEMPNRRNYDERFRRNWKRAVRDKTPISVALLDVDFFKQYNDNYGHARGDEVLKAIASTITGELKRPADFAARWGGEEFVILLPDTGAQGARELVEWTRLAVEKIKIEHVYSEASNVVTISAGGVTILPDNDDDPGQMIEIADQMLYKAKESGRNRICWHDLE